MFNNINSLIIARLNFGSVNPTTTTTTTTTAVPTLWNQRGSDINGEAVGDYSGFSVSLSSDGSILAIGAYTNDGNGSDSGHVRVYQSI